MLKLLLYSNLVACVILIRIISRRILNGKHLWTNLTENSEESNLCDQC